MCASFRKRLYPICYTGAISYTPYIEICTCMIYVQFRGSTQFCVYCDTYQPERVHYVLTTIQAPHFFTCCCYCCCDSSTAQQLTPERCGPHTLISYDVNYILWTHNITVVTLPGISSAPFRGLNVYYMQYVIHQNKNGSIYVHSLVW